MVIDTTDGPIDEQFLDREDGLIDDAARFGYFRKYRRKGTDVVVHHAEGTAFLKVNPFDVAQLPDDLLVPVDLGTGTIEQMPASALERRSGTSDNADEFSAWVEYRLPGTDQIVHRSAHVFTKKATVAGAAVAASVG